MSVHISAEKGEIAEAVLLPGDPRRAQFVAEEFLTDVHQYNQVRGMLGYTGRYKGVSVSVQGSGMGMPSLAIYTNELIREYDVQRLIRIGSCGSIQSHVNIRDLVVALSASTDSAMNTERFNGMTFAATATWSLIQKATAILEEGNIPYHCGNILSSDTFYRDDPASWKLWAQHQVLAIEMEANQLYTLAARYGVEALALLTVSDSLVTMDPSDDLSSEERERSFHGMVETALSCAV
jgi:purine-nucleoside phosphorylase